MSKNKFHLINPNSAEQSIWDELVKKSGGSVASLSIYLNAVMGNWMILYNEDRTGGMVCAYFRKMGQMLLVNPIYHPYAEWIGEGELTNEAVEYLKTEFNFAEYFVKKIDNSTKKRIHQVIASKDFKLNTLAKRMLKKSENYKISLNEEVNSIYEAVKRDLVGRVDGMNSGNINSLQQVANSFVGNGLRSYCAYENNRFVGGIWVIENNNSFYFLKGSVENEAKKNGVMYSLIHTAVQDSITLGKVFYFGGSNAESVRKFNLNLGGVDEQYAVIEWNNCPWYWNLVRFIKKKIG